MARSRLGRLYRRPQDDQVARNAQAAQDAAVAAFLDLDTRQSYVADAIGAVAGTVPNGVPGNSPGGHGTSGSALVSSWQPIAQQSFDASAAYLQTAEKHSLVDPAENRPTGVDPVSAGSAFTEVSRQLAAAAAAVDSFYQGHIEALEEARSLRAATPILASDARTAATGIEAELTAADAAGLAYPSVLNAAGELIAELSALKTAETVGNPAEIRRAAGAVQAAVANVGARIAAAKTLLPSVRSSIASVRTRIEAVTSRLESLPATRSALLREFSADCSKDLNGVDDQARTALADGRSEWTAARVSLDAGNPELAAAQLATARSRLAAAQAAADALIDRLGVLRAVRADPAEAARTTRFRLRDAQLLVVDRKLVPQWGSVLDAQAARIERAAAELTGRHPDYWAYVQTLRSVEAFVRGVVDKVRLSH